MRLFSGGDSWGPKFRTTLLGIRVLCTALLCSDGHRGPPALPTVSPTLPKESVPLLYVRPRGIASSAPDHQGDAAEGLALRGVHRV